MRSRPSRRLLEIDALRQAVAFTRALVTAGRRVWWRGRRKSVIRSYFATHTVRRLNLGAGNAPSPEWLNSDLDPPPAGSLTDPVIFLDARARFPFPDEKLHYIRSEHMIQTLTYDEAGSMLAECMRVLVPGGRVRIATPDLDRFASLYQNRAHPSTEEGSYVEWVATHLFADLTRSTPTFVLNNVFRAWGHTFLFDEETLRGLLVVAGFDDVRRYSPGESDDPALMGVETHGAAIENEQANAFETMILEARKPPTRLAATPDYRRSTD